MGSIRCKFLILNRFLSLVTSVSTKDIISGRLIFSLGQNNLYRKNSYKVPSGKISIHPQGYCIIPDSIHRNLVFLNGTEPVGDYYAAVTASQLLDDSSFVYNQALVIDYPAAPVLQKFQDKCRFAHEVTQWREHPTP